MHQALSCTEGRAHQNCHLDQGAKKIDQAQKRRKCNKSEAILRHKSLNWPKGEIPVLVVNTRNRVFNEDCIELPIDHMSLFVCNRSKCDLSRVKSSHPNYFSILGPDGSSPNSKCAFFVILGIFKAILSL